MEPDLFFRDCWPATAATLRAWLVRSGARSHDVEDVVQETATRLLRTWDRIDTDADVGPLARTIAINVYRDELRSGRRREVPGDVPDAAAPAEDVERRAMARLMLDRAVHAIAALPAAQRLALDTSLAREDEEPRTAAERMALMRARRAVRVAARSAVATVVAMRMRLFRRPAATTAAGVGLVAVVVLLMPSVAPEAADPGRQPAPPAGAVPVAGPQQDADVPAPHGSPAVRHVLPKQAGPPSGPPGLVPELPKPPRPWIDVPSLVLPGGRTVRLGESPAKPACVTGEGTPAQLRCGGGAAG